MGIDKANVRFIIHDQMPANVDEYLQQVGRSGRDGKPSICTLFHHAGDFDYNEGLFHSDLRKKKCTNDEYQRKMQSLTEFNQFLETKNDCRRKFLLEYLGEYVKMKNCNACDNCGFIDMQVPQNKHEFIPAKKQEEEKKEEENPEAVDLSNIF